MGIVNDVLHKFHMEPKGWLGKLAVDLVEGAATAAVIVGTGGAALPLVAAGEFAVEAWAKDGNLLAAAGSTLFNVGFAALPGGAAAGAGKSALTKLATVTGANPTLVNKFAQFTLNQLPKAKNIVGAAVTKAAPLLPGGTATLGKLGTKIVSTTEASAAFGTNRVLPFTESLLSRFSGLVGTAAVKGGNAVAGIGGKLTGTPVP